MMTSEDTITDDLPELTQEELSTFKAALDGETHKSYEPIKFDDPVQMLYMIDENFREGKRSLHYWQIKTNQFIAQDIFTVQKRLRLYIAACNGSGKDSYIITLLAIFLTITKIRHRCIITSSSYTQMYTQTQSYIRTMANLCNKYFAAIGLCPKAFIIKKDHIVCVLTGSEIKMFVTDDPGRAEGYHPFPDTPGAELCVIVNEAKSVTDEIFTALRRCTYSRWIEVSSTKTMTGHFYEKFHNANDLDLDEFNYIQGKSYRIRVTYKDCPHISEEAYQEDVEDAGSEDADFIKSKYWSIFTSSDDDIIIEPSIVDRVFDNPIPHKNIPSIGRRAGLDLAASAKGDENVLVVLDGNEVIAVESFRQQNTVSTRNYLITLFEKYNLIPSNIFADDGGIGRGIIDQLYEKQWPVNRVLNQSAAINKIQYGNRGAELWFQTQKILDRQLIRVHESVKLNKLLRRQLSTRYYKKNQIKGQIILEGKKDAKSRGHGSPDRADAFVLAFTGLTYRNFLSNTKDPTKQDANKLPNIPPSRYDLEAIIRRQQNQKKIYIGPPGNNGNHMRPSDKFLAKIKLSPEVNPRRGHKNPLKLVNRLLTFK